MLPRSPSSHCQTLGGNEIRATDSGDPRIVVARSLGAKRAGTELEPEEASDEEIGSGEPLEPIFHPYVFIDKNRVFFLCHRLKGCAYRLDIAKDGRHFDLTISYPGFKAADVKCDVLQLDHDPEAGNPCTKSTAFPLPDGEKAAPPIEWHKLLPNENLILASCPLQRAVQARSSSEVTEV